MSLAPRLFSSDRSVGCGGVMNESEFSTYVALVAWMLAYSVSMLLVAAKTGPLKVAGSAGGTCQMKPTAPESRIDGTVNFQNDQPPVARPLSYGQVE